MPIDQFHYQLLEMIENARSFSKLSPLYLGSPPGGYIGLLPQDRVKYDIAESGTLAGSGSLLDNLNHIRYRLETLESGVSPGSISVYEDDVLIASGVTVLNFEGAVAVTDNGAGKATVLVSGVTGSGGSSPAGLDKYVQYNENGNFGASIGFKFDYSQNAVVLEGDGQFAGIFAEVFADGPTTAPSIIGFRNRGSKASRSELLDGDSLFRFRGRGWDGTGYSNTQADHRITAAGDWSAVNHGTNHEFWLTPSGSTTMMLAATLTSSGLDLASGLQYTVNGSSIGGGGSWDGDITDIDETSSADIGEDIADDDQGIIFNQSSNAGAGEWERFEYQRLKNYYMHPALQLMGAPSNLSTFFGDKASLPGAWSWAGSPFITPDTIDYEWRGKALYYRDTTGVSRTFLYRSLTTGTNKFDYLVYLSGFLYSNGYFQGIRIDNGTDNYYVEFGQYYSTTGLPIRFYYYYRNGGGVTSGELNSNWRMPIMPPYFWTSIAIRSTPFSNWDCRGQIVTDQIWQNTIVSGLTWTPTRIGITQRRTSSPWDSSFFASDGEEII